MTKEIKLLALDLDGTTLNSQKEISQENLTALEAARQAGIHVVLTTGRPLLSIKQYLKKLSLDNADNFSITFNGALVQRNDGEMIAQKSFLHEDLEKIYELTKKYDLPFDVVNDTNVFVTDNRSEYSQVNHLMNFVPVKFDEIPQGIIYNKVVSCTLPVKLDEAFAKFPEDLMNDYEIFKTQPRLLEFMPKGINKAFGLAQLTEYLGLTAENVMAVGDEGNDVSMIKWAKYGTAVKNATNEVKSHAKILSNLTNDENAIAALINEYIL